MNKGSGGDGIPAELFQILKDDAVKVLHSICQQIWKNSARPQDLKRSVLILNPKKGNAKECSNYLTRQQGNAQNPSSQASTVHEPRTSRCTSWIQKKKKKKNQRNQRSNSQHLLENLKKREFQKNIYFCFIDYAKAFDCVDHNKLGNSERWEHQTT